MSSHWRFQTDETALLESIVRATGLSPLAARIALNRGMRTPDAVTAFLEPTLAALSDPFLMNGMERAVGRLLRALAEREHVVVYGDSDVDGVSGTALLTGFFAAIGMSVSSYIPNRLAEGYSLTPRGLAEIERRGARVVVTVDNGTTAAGPIAALQARGVDVIVTDHHNVPEMLPPCFAFLNPKWAECGYPFPHLCGTGVSFQLLSALATRLPARGGALEAMRDLARHAIGYVALATICDMVPLVGENRALARAGLAALNDTRHPGLKALLAIAGVGKRVHADDVSFRLGPRINAAGRLGQAEQALELLLADSKEQARALARKLDEKNLHRQDLEADILASARRRARDVGGDEPVIVLADEAWHPGVVGIVANRLALEFQRPTVLIGLREGVGRGSGRSVAGFDLHAALVCCSEHLKSFGGHAFAAGLEIEAGQVDAFRAAMIRYATGDRDCEANKRRELWIDAEVHLGALEPALLFELDKLGPYGVGNPLPTLVTPALRLASPPRCVGRTRSHLSLALCQGNVQRKAIAYGMAAHAERLSAPGCTFAVAFTPRMNLFAGQPAVELEVHDFRLANEDA